MIFVGLKEGRRQVFFSDTSPTETSHGAQYLAVIGPFDTLAGANFMAHFGAGNPHCQCVSDAERLAGMATPHAGVSLTSIGMLGQTGPGPMSGLFGD